MKFRLLITTIILSAAFYLCSAQSPMYYGNQTGNFNPDSLKPVTITGKVIADSSMMNGMYFIDVNNDNSPDYALIFGPYWYTPDSSSAVRPNVGDVITITGGLYNGMFNYLPMVVVYTINGNFWRSPFNSYWDNMGMNSMMGGYGHMGMGYAFGWNHDSLQSITLNGKILVDSTFMYNQYYLDTNGDSTPDYFLNFGPPWYMPSSGINFPGNGDNVSISGWEIKTGYMNMIIVYKLNGHVWMDSTQFNSSLGGGWINTGLSSRQQFFCPFDTTDWMQVNPGWNKGGMMGGGYMFPDSVYCQILEVFPQNVPADSSQNIMAAFEVGVFYPDGMNGMWQSGGMGGYMNFNSMVNFQFHFNNIQSSGFNFNNGNMKVKYWDNQNNQWNVLNNSKLNTTNNTVEVSQKQVSNFYIVTADKITDVKNLKSNVPGSFILEQNFPNPFNPTTIINYQIPSNNYVTLKVYNILGNVVKTLVDGYKTEGKYSASFNASKLASGIYFYRLQSGNLISIKKMVLLK